MKLDENKGAELSRTLGKAIENSIVSTLKAFQSQGEKTQIQTADIALGIIMGVRMPVDILFSEQDARSLYKVLENSFAKAAKPKNKIEVVSK